jgi:hypothetical protein
MINQALPKGKEKPLLLGFSVSVSDKFREKTREVVFSNIEC